jgi:hypothetical protein
MKKLTVYELREIIRAIREGVEYIRWLQNHQAPHTINSMETPEDTRAKLHKSADKLELFVNGIEVKV